MNDKLYRIHRGIFVLYISFIALLASTTVMALFRHDPDALYGLTGVIFFMLVSVFHYYAAKGVRSGKAWGRTMSNIAALIMVFVFPIGTILGIYIFKQIGENYEFKYEPSNDN